MQVLIVSFFLFLGSTLSTTWELPYKNNQVYDTPSINTYPDALDFADAVYVPDIDTIVLFGGISKSMSNLRASNNVWFYFSQNNTWEHRLGSYGSIPADYMANTIGSLSGHKMVYNHLDGLIYVFGGAGTDGIEEGRL